MLPLYKQTARLVGRSPLARAKKPALGAAAVGLALLFLLFFSLARNGDVPQVPAVSIVPAAPEPEELSPPVLATAINTGGGGRARALTPTPLDPPDVGVQLREAPAIDDAENATEPEPAAATPLPIVARLLLPLVAGYCFGFLGSVPIAGPTSAMVLKLGIQGKYQSALTIAVGGAISEATYAGIAFWGFGSFLAGAKFLLPVSKVLGAIMFTAVGVVFLRSEMKSPLKTETDTAAQLKGVEMKGKARDEVVKNILLGLTMSGINPALLATYTGAIASVYGTGMLEFNLLLALVFGLGVCSGVSSWFYLLLSLLKKYKQRLKDQTIRRIMRGMGCFLLSLGLYCAKSSFDYFVWGPPTEGK